MLLIKAAPQKIEKCNKNIEPKMTGTLDTVVVYVDSLWAVLKNDNMIIIGKNDNMIK